MRPKANIRSLRDGPVAPPKPGAFYIHPWPDDLPPNCQLCGTKFRPRFNLTTGPGKIGRIFRKIAYYGFLPCIGIGIILPGIIPEFYHSFDHSRGWWAFFGIMFFPPMILFILSTIMPRSRHLVCKKCGWNRDYPTLPTPKFNPTKNTDKTDS